MNRILEVGKLRPLSIALFLGAFFLCGSGNEMKAVETSDPNATIAKALDILAGESVIVSRYQSARDGSRPYELAWAFSAIVEKARDPIAEFVRLAKSGSYYGLIGLHKLNPAKYRDALATFSGSPEVRIVSNDSFVDMSAADFVTHDMESYGDAMYEKLLFPVLPKWEDTVKVKVELRDRRDTLLGGSRLNR